jgi:protein tyrosine phosphatase (PTP) superfamily phosphohydrolase (DUF442 family)
MDAAMRKTAFFFCLFIPLGCESPGGATPATPVAVTLDSQGAPAGLHHHRRWSEKIGQGAQPEGEEAFRNLAALGYTTILSVDGSAPDVETAAKHGLTYVHVPIGYDGVAPEEQVAIVKAVKEAKGPVYVHCHHGKHRGPAAAMVARICVDGISNEEAVKGLEISETSPNYEGLYRDVRECRPPSAGAIAKAPPPQSRVMPQGVRATMVSVDQRFELLKASQAEGWKTPKDHPDVSPAHEARMLWELYRELARTDEAKAKGPDFLSHAVEAEKLGTTLEEAIRAGNAEAAGKAYKGLKKNCDACHSVYRN